MSKTLQIGESTCNKILDSGFTGSYFLLHEKSPKDLSKLEGDFCKALSQRKARGIVGNFIATSNYIPSINAQLQSIKACKNLEKKLVSQYVALGYDNTKAISLATKYKEEFSKKCEPLVLYKNVPSSISELLDMVALGQVQDEYFSIILLQHTKDTSTLKELSLQYEGVEFINKTRDIEQVLDKLTCMMLCLFAISLVLVIAILCFFYNKKQIAKICCVPMCIILCMSAFFAITKTPIDFFVASALSLVFGLALDYIIHIIQVETKDNVANIAVNLSFVTTALSFGALSLTSFAPVAIFGRTVLVSLTVAFLCSKALKN